MKVLTSTSLGWWFSCFVAGLLFSLISHYEYIIFTLALLAVGSQFFGAISLKLRAILLYSSIIFLLGGFAMDGIFPSRNELLSKKGGYYIGKVEQQLNVGQTWTTNLVQLSHRKWGTEWVSTTDKVVLLTENGVDSIQEGHVLLFHSELKEVGPKGNPGEFNAQMYWYSKGLRYQGFGMESHVRIVDYQPISWFKQTLNTVRMYATRVLDEYVGERDAPLIKAILLGDKHDLDLETKRVFTNTGAMHMLAVSGMHIGLIVVILNAIFKRLFFHKGRKIALVLMIVILWFYAFLTGFSASVTRAVAMFTIIVLAQFLRRGYHPINSLALAGFFILLWDPVQVFDVGFQLSFLAMLGIFTIYPLLENLLSFKWSILKTGWEGTAIGIASQVFTVPISIFYFNQFPNYFLLTNFAVMLFSGVMLGLAIALLAIGSLRYLAIPVGWFLAICCSLLVSFIAMVETLPGALAVGFTPSWLWVICCYIVTVLALSWSEKRKWRAVFLLLIPIVAWLQWGRLLNLNQSEFVVFNSNYPTVLFNQRGVQYCFYNGMEKALTQAERLTSDYQKIHPGKVDFIPISEGMYEVTAPNFNWKITVNNGWYALESANEKFALIYSDRVVISEIIDQYTILLLRASNEDNVISLENGAFRYEFDNKLKKN